MNSLEPFLSITILSPDFILIYSTSLRIELFCPAEIMLEFRLSDSLLSSFWILWGVMSIVSDIFKPNLCGWMPLL